MWALLRLGNDTIGQNWIVVLAQRKLEWGADSRGELGEICATPPQRQRVLMGRSFG
jgi:hypothetical protein